MGKRGMLKIVGTEHGEVVDEKVIITDDGKLTKFGIAIVCMELIADVGIFFLISKIIKKIKG